MALWEFTELIFRMLEEDTYALGEGRRMIISSLNLVGGTMKEAVSSVLSMRFFKCVSNRKQKAGS